MNVNVKSAQVAYFKQHGYLALPLFWSENEIVAMRHELIRLQQAGLLTNVATAGDGITTSTAHQNLQLCPMSPHSGLFRAMPFAPKVVSLVSALIGDPAVLHLDQVFVKPGRTGTATNWHQDNAYFHIDDPLKGIAIWTAVHDADLANGTINVIPDAFREELEHSRDPDSNHHIRCYPDEEKAVPLVLPAGGIAVFCYGTPHRTGPNITDKDRAGVALHFYNGDCTVSGGFAGEKPLYVTGRGADNGVSRFGVDLAADWEVQVLDSCLNDPSF